MMDRILEAGNVAPMAVNYQLQKIYVLQSEEVLTKVKSVCPCTCDAPTVLLFAYDDDKDWNNPKQTVIHSGQQAVSIMATHIMLEAWELGVASCRVNLFPNDEVQKKKRQALQQRSPRNLRVPASVVPLPAASPLQESSTVSVSLREATPPSSQITLQRRPARIRLRLSGKQLSHRPEEPLQRPAQGKGWFSEEGCF